MRAGQLRHRVTLQSRGSGQAASGQLNGDWADVTTCWAAIEPLQGREYWAAQQVNAEVTVRIRMRYLPGVTSAMRAVYDGRTYDILVVIDPQERHAELRLMCREVI